MKITILSTQSDNKSYFSQEIIETPNTQPLGNYSIPFASNSIQFREFEADLIYPMHNAPRVQYIIYLEGSVKVRASGGETRIFHPGDILLAKDVQGEGHESTTLEKGRAVIIGIDK
jgi:hypothetical protein